MGGDGAMCLGTLRASPRLRIHLAAMLQPFSEWRVSSPVHWRHSQAIEEAIDLATDRQFIGRVFTTYQLADQVLHL